jgi:hypothetical protein
MTQDVDHNIHILSEQVQTLETENKLLRRELRVVSMQSLSDLGQAQDAYAAQLAAEEKLAKAIAAIEEMQTASDAMMLHIARTIIAELKGEDA